MTKGNMNRRTMLRGAALGALATPALVGKGIAQGKVNWRVQAHWPKASSSFTDSLGKLAEVLETRTEGAFKMDLLGAGEFAKGPDIYNIVRKGVVPMGTVSPSYVQDQAQAASFLFGIPGTFRQAWEMEHAVKNLGLEALVNEDLNADGVMMKTEKVLPVEIVVSKKIESAEDFKGLKLRSSGTMLDYLQSAGAAPQYIPGSELYQSLSFILNMEAVDGLEDDLRTALLDTMETRFFQRSAEYQHAEAIAISSGIAENNIEVSELPDDVLAILADASAKILDTEAQKGERAAKAADIYKTLMTDLGYL